MLEHGWVTQGCSPRLHHKEPMRMLIVCHSQVYGLERRTRDNQSPAPISSAEFWSNSEASDPESARSSEAMSYWCLEAGASQRVDSKHQPSLVGK